MASKKFCWVVETKSGGSWFTCGAYRSEEEAREVAERNAAFSGSEYRYRKAFEIKEGQ